MSSTVDELLTVTTTANDNPGKWEGYLKETKHIAALDTAERYKAYALEGMGNGISVSVRPAQPSQKYLYPFVQYMKENALYKYFPEKDDRPKRVSNVEKLQGNANNSRGLIHITTTPILQKDDYIGIGLVDATKLADVTLADTLISNYTVVCSADGKHWTKVTDKAALLQDFVKYVCIKNTSDAPRSLRLTRKQFSLQLPEATKLTSVTLPQGNIWDGHTGNYLTDGDYNTFVCLHRCQYNGDLYTVKMAHLAPVYDVRVCMGTVNGDHMNVGNVEISKDGKSWKKIYVKGTRLYDFRMNMAQVVKYSDEMSYCDFDADGQEAQYVRFNVKNARTDKWLRFYELEVNKKGDQLQYLSECVDKEGVGIDELSDQLAYTQMNNVQQSLTCHFNDIHYLKAVEIYQDASVSASNPAQIMISSDGQEWKEYGQLTENRQVVDLTRQEDATRMKLIWTGTAPAIYEIIPVTDETRQAEVTKVEQLTAATSSVDFKYNGKTVTVSAAQGVKAVDVYTMSGQAVLSYQAAGAKYVQMPMLANGSSAYIVKVALDNGEISSYKVVCK